MKQKIGLLIGGNRGIGKALAVELATHWGDDGKVYLTARQEAAAVQARAEGEKLTRSELGCFTFDLSNPEDPKRVADELKELHGGIDLVIQNGAYLPRYGYPAIDDARPMIESNSHGTLRVLEAFLPVLNEYGYIIVVASALGVLKNLPEHLRGAFNTRCNSPSQICAAIDRYVEAVESGEASKLGWPDWVNIPSKVAQVALTRSFARQVSEQGKLPPGATISVACPGVTLTDATREFMGTVFREEEAQTPEEAAKGLIKLFSNKNNRSMHGELVQHGEMIPFGD